ncbi:hypothetical protein ACFV7Q_35300 [Streptomyces sp. NPDC059851]|uniref:hypothetical protein n=1 Tax=Streptomyces sp. NPDC059851 TaxID=3346971 RepID=UPI0036546884
MANVGQHMEAAVRQARHQPPQARPMRRWVKWLIALAVLLVIGPPLAFLYAFTRPETRETRPAACAKAMKGIGWRLPARVDDEACTEIDSSIFATAWAGSFRMPRSDVRDWLASLPSHRGSSPRLQEDPLRLSIVPPSYGRIDSVDIAVDWQGEADAVVRFETHNG